jgi:hypothetical protein
MDSPAQPIPTYAEMQRKLAPPFAYDFSKRPFILEDVLAAYYTMNCDVIDAAKAAFGHWTHNVHLDNYWFDQNMTNASSAIYLFHFIAMLGYPVFIQCSWTTKGVRVAVPLGRMLRCEPMDANERITDRFSFYVYFDPESTTLSPTQKAEADAAKKAAVLRLIEVQYKI